MQKSFQINFGKNENTILLSNTYNVNKNYYSGGEDQSISINKKNKYLIGSLDGLGGAGTRKLEYIGSKYQKFTNVLQTGSYFASRVTKYTIEELFNETTDVNDFLAHLRKQIIKELSDFKNNANIKSQLVFRVRNSANVFLPTTMALVYITFSSKNTKLSAFWVGDSIICIWDTRYGILQINENAGNWFDYSMHYHEDNVMKSVVSENDSFEIEKQEIEFLDQNIPYIIFTGSDGIQKCFEDYLEMEKVFHEILYMTNDLNEFKDILTSYLQKNKRDDVSFSLLVINVKSYKDLQNAYHTRSESIQYFFKKQKMRGIAKEQLIKEQLLQYEKIYMHGEKIRKYGKC